MFFGIMSGRHAGSMHVVEQMIHLGAAAVEITYYPSQFGTAVFSRHLTQVLDVAAAHGVKLMVHAPIQDINLGSLNRRMREASMAEIRDALLFAEEIGAELVVLHPGPNLNAMPVGSWSGEWATPDNDRIRQANKLAAAAVGQLADEFPDMRLAVENLVFPHERIRTPAEHAAFLDQVGRANVGACLDAAHATVSRQDPLAFLPVLGDRVIHVHFSDNGGYVDEHLVPYTGTIDFDAMMTALAGRDYAGAIIFECVFQTGDEYGACAQRLTQAARSAG